ncbi:peptide chain release factor 1 [Chloroflexota bacterium]
MTEISTKTLINKLDGIEKRYNELGELMAKPDIATDFEQIKTYSQEQSSIEDLVNKYRDYIATLKSLEETRQVMDETSDEEMAEMAKEEIETLKAKSESLLRDIKVSLLPKDPADKKDVIVEIRAGAGGEEAGLFAADLYRAYSRYAMSRRWTVELINSNESGIGGFKEIVFEIKGKGAYSRLKYESGVHRVQRVPSTESGGRLHTSTATVAVLPEADDVDIEINPDDLRIDAFRASGAGGQHVNKTSSAIRITHIPTGIVSTCQDERSQLKNKTKAMAVLRTRLYDIELAKQQDKMTSQRRSQVGTADRSEKIRTYNFPQDRVTDHRIGITVHNLPGILEGNLDQLIDAVATAQQAKQLEESLV